MIDAILYGNGFNQLNNNLSWDKLLSRSTKKSKMLVEIPPTIQYEMGVLDFLKDQDVIIKNSKFSREYNFKLDIVDELKKLKRCPLYDDLNSINVQLFLTPNYDYNINYRGKYDSVKDSSENVYSIHRWYKITEDKIVYPFHGEMAYPKTIQLGYDHYCGSLSRLDRYIKGSYLFNEKRTDPVPSMSERLKNSTDLCLGDFTKYTHGINNILSWIDAFFFTNLHIIGFGMDFSEIDVWWLLNRRARMMADLNETISNKIVYYDVEPINNNNPKHLNKLELLKNFNVEVIRSSFNDENDYESRYREQIEKIKRSIE